MIYEIKRRGEVVGRSDDFDIAKRMAGKNATVIGTEIIVAESPRAVAVENATCEHRGEVAETVGCETCGGNVRIKVFACTMHGRCQLSAKIPGIHVCGQ